MVSLIMERERTHRVVILYAVYMYSQGLSLRAVSACLEDLCPRSHVSVWNWVQRFSRLNDCYTVRRVRCFMLDETWIKVGSQEAWLCLAFEPYGRLFLGFFLSRTRNILTTELLLQSLIDRYGRYSIYLNGVDWYSAACHSLGLEHHVYDAVRGNLMERFVQYVKDRTEGFDDYFPCRRERCRFEHVKGWLSYHMFGFNLFKRRDAFKQSPILQLSQIIRGPKDPPQLNTACRLLEILFSRY